jgi:hypothetical protein
MTPTIGTPGDVVDPSRSSTNAPALTPPLSTPSGAALDALRELYEQTTFRAPLRVEDGPDPMIRDDEGWWVAQVCSKSVTGEPSDDGRPNAAFIAALLNAWPALLTEHTALREKLDALDALCPEDFGPAEYIGVMERSDARLQAEVARLSSENAALSTRLAVAGEELAEEKARLDAISVPGAQTRVAMRALENRAGPPMRRYAMASIPSGLRGTVSSDRPTLREAIDAARRSPTTRGET